MFHQTLQCIHIYEMVQIASYWIDTELKQFIIINIQTNDK